MPLTGSYPPLIVILGPTAIGKTDLAINLALALNGEIIGADSRQIYRHMDIGTAKPTAVQREKVPHHLIDLIEPDDTLTVARYQTMAYDKIDALHKTHKLPFLVGGTGQYTTAVVEGWSIPEVPPNDALRTELETFAKEHGTLALYERLREIDPAAAEKIHPNNVRRVVRALEVSIESGTPISVLQQKKPPAYTILQIGLTMEREKLYERADKRVDQMMEKGFLSEVKKLLNMGYDRRLSSMSGLGYRELASHLLDDTPLDVAIEDTKIATHQFIRRQYTWFRGHDEGVIWHNMQQLNPDSLIDDLKNWLDRHALF